MIDHKALMQAMDEAAAHRHPQRAMRVTLECGHLRLMPQIDTVMGIGATTGCAICPDRPGRTVVNCEETGVLHDSYQPPENADPAASPAAPVSADDHTTSR